MIPHAKKVFELVEMMKKNTVVDGADLDGVFEVATFLKPGATKEQIAALEKRLSTTFQESEEAVLLGNRLLGDYKDFLRASNRIGEGMFYCAEDVNTDDEWMCNMICFLLMVSIRTARIRNSTRSNLEDTQSSLLGRVRERERYHFYHPSQSGP